MKMKSQKKTPVKKTNKCKEIFNYIDVWSFSMYLVAICLWIALTIIWIVRSVKGDTTALVTWMACLEVSILLGLRLRDTINYNKEKFKSQEQIFKLKKTLEHVEDELDKPLNSENPDNI